MLLCELQRERNVSEVTCNYVSVVTLRIKKINWFPERVEKSGGTAWLRRRRVYFPRWTPAFAKARVLEQLEALGTQTAGLEADERCAARSQTKGDRLFQSPTVKQVICTKT